MRQYYGVKDRHPQAVVLFRMGDFYETFEDDAKTVSRLLGITLTSRNNGKADDVPMAGFPHHALDSHLPKLVRAGLRVAICEQIEDASTSTGAIVERDVVEVVTPGVSFHDELLNPKQANYLAAVHFGTGRDSGRLGFAYVDASTGAFYVTEAPAEKFAALVQTVGPAELILDKRRRDRLDALRETPFTVTPQEDWVFGYDFAYETLLRHFETHSLKGFGVDDLDLGLVAAGAALHYLDETQTAEGALRHVRRLRRFSEDDHIALDPQTKRNLELVRPIQDAAGTEGSLIGILDTTQTPMGGRRLRAWLVRPLRRVETIRWRQAGVATLAARRALREELRGLLAQVGDLERLAGKVASGRATPRDVAAVRHTLEQIPPVLACLDGVGCDTLAALAERLTPADAVVGRIRRALVDDPPAKLTDGGLIREGYSDELDELRAVATSGKDWLATLQKDEAERTGISSLKVGFNKVFGYYLEVTNTHKDKVPDNYIRKQTLTKAERYITPELKEYEEKILTAEEKIGELEQQLFGDLRRTLAEATPELQHDAALLARLDALAALADVAVRHGYVRPEVDDGLVLDIQDGRHPVVEQALPPATRSSPTTRTSTPTPSRSSSSPGPTWRARAWCCGRWASSCSWRRWAASCPRRPRAWASSTASSRAWAPPTTSPRARARSWWR